MATPMSEDSDPGAPLVGVVVVSDRANAFKLLTSAGLDPGTAYEDLGGPAVQSYLERTFATPLEFEYRLIPDERPRVVETLRELADRLDCCLIVTTGGTGPSPRDVTVDATIEACEKLLPGFGEVMRAVSLKVVPTAILSRQTAGIRGGTLIVNVPGSPKAIAECLDAVVAAIPDCVDLIGGPRLDLADEEAYRPHG